MKNKDWKQHDIYRDTTNFVNAEYPYRWDVINHVIKSAGYTTYLEIGLRRGQNFLKIEIDQKESVDPRPMNGFIQPTHVMTSDEFFKNCPVDKKWDCIFIDGLHEKSQVERDIHNAFNHLNEGGIVFTHDVNVLEKSMTKQSTCGDAWETFVKIRYTEPELVAYCVPFDYLGMIERRSHENEFLVLNPTDFLPENLKFEWMAENRIAVLNVITEQQFNERWPL